MITNIQDDILYLHSKNLLQHLLVDKTTKRNIIWATSGFDQYGAKYGRNEQIKPGLITGVNSNVIKTRARKVLEQQAQLTKKHAEVFTPLWVCKKMNDYADEEWFGRSNAFSEDKVDFQDKSWQDYVTDCRMELTMGEAPFLTSRYNVETGEAIPVDKRIGLLDRKLRVVSENTDTQEDWFSWVVKAYQSTYGYEYQGDNLLIARVNLLKTFEEVLKDKWDRDPTTAEYKKIIGIIVWNCWQMDGLTGLVPFSTGDGAQQMDFFQQRGDDLIQEEEQIEALIYDWDRKKSDVYIKLKERRETMKFDYIIGNPPYQDDSLGDNKKYTPPIYNFFMDESFEIANCVLLIHPARFLFNAGSTDKKWNKKILNDVHFKILEYFVNSYDVFPNVDIKGGVAISLHNKLEKYEVIGIFTAYQELTKILDSIGCFDSSLTQIITGRGAYKLSNRALEEYPEIVQLQSKGHQKDIGAGAFKILTDVIYFEEQPDDNFEYVRILGLLNNKRIYRFIRKDFVDGPHSFQHFKVFIPKSNGSGALGEVLSTPLIGEPLIGVTDSFLTIGNFTTRAEAQNCLKYVKSKFARALLGVLKVTQDNPRSTWKYVPLQDFTSSSDIDWSQSISGIDQQLYKKYGLSEEEIDFIETRVKEME